MSKDLVRIETTRASDELLLTSFYGGNDRGSCVQINQVHQNGGHYVQLSQADAIALANSLLLWANLR